MLLRALFCTEMSCQEQGYPKISWWYLREWEGHCGWGRMRERFQLNQHGGRSVQASFLKLLGFKIFSRYNMSTNLLEFLFLEVLLCYGIAFVFSCYALGVQICLTVPIHSTARLTLAVPAFLKKNCSIFACES